MLARLLTLSDSQTAEHPCAPPEPVRQSDSRDMPVRLLSLSESQTAEARMRGPSACQARNAPRHTLGGATGPAVGLAPERAVARGTLVGVVLHCCLSEGDLDLALAG